MWRADGKMREFQSESGAREIAGFINQLSLIALSSKMYLNSVAI